MISDRQHLSGTANLDLYKNDGLFRIPLVLFN